MVNTGAEVSDDDLFPQKELIRRMYSVTHTIELPPVTLPQGVSMRVVKVSGDAGEKCLVYMSASTSTTRGDAVATLKQALLSLQQAATGDVS